MPCWLVFGDHAALRRDVWRAETFSNYVSQLHDVGPCHGLMDEPLLKRAKATVRRQELPPRVRIFIQKPLLILLMRKALMESDEIAAMLYLTAYTFLLRVPSECLPLTAAGDPCATLPKGKHSAIAAVQGDELILRLARRKNRPHGSVIRRGCTCAADERLCAVHVVGRWWAAQAGGARPFAGVSAAWAGCELRRRLKLLDVGGADNFCLHDFRRGHAQDLVESGADLQRILRAGKWVSPAFLKYLDTVKCEKTAVVRARLDESDGEDDIAQRPSVPWWVCNRTNK